MPLLVQLLLVLLAFDYAKPVYVTEILNGGENLSTDRAHFSNEIYNENHADSHTADKKKLAEIPEIANSNRTPCINEAKSAEPTTGTPKYASTNSRVGYMVYFNIYAVIVIICDIVMWSYFVYFAFKICSRHSREGANQSVKELRFNAVPLNVLGILYVMFITAIVVIPMPAVTDDHVNKSPNKVVLTEDSSKHAPLTVIQCFAYDKTDSPSYTMAFILGIQYFVVLTMVGVFIWLLISFWLRYKQLRANPNKLAQVKLRRQRKIKTGNWKILALLRIALRVTLMSVTLLLYVNTLPSVENLLKLELEMNLLLCFLFLLCNYIVVDILNPPIKMVKCCNCADMEKSIKPEGKEDPTEINENLKNETSVKIDPELKISKDNEAPHVVHIFTIPS